MKSLYINSVEPYSGKTAACLALGRHLQGEGYKVRYLKPFSMQPKLIAGKLADEDASFAKEALKLPEDPWDLSPVVMTAERLHKILAGEAPGDLMEYVKTRCGRTLQECELLVLEGTGNLQEGYIVGLNASAVCRSLDSLALVIIRYKSEWHLLDDALAVKARLGERLAGVLVNRVPEAEMGFIKEQAIPYLESKGVPVFGAIPEVSALESLTVQEIIDALDAQVLTNYNKPQGVVEQLTIGAMTADAALSRFRRQPNKAVITGGDRTDIQLAALETSTTCLILTGNLRPSPLIIKQADQFGVPVLLVRYNTMETVEKIEHIFGKTRLAQTAKLAQYEKLLVEHTDLKRLYRVIGL